jgi:hypothetical protein
VANNQIDIAPSLPSTYGIELGANGIDNFNINVANNTILGTSVTQIAIYPGGPAYSSTNHNITINGNTLTGALSSANGFYLWACAIVTLKGNIVNVFTGLACELINTTGLRAECNNFVTETGTVTLTTSNTCAGSVIGESNYLVAGSLSGNNAVTNGGTGCNVRQFSSAVPSTGTAAVGDVCYNTAGATPFAWLYESTGWTGLTIP